jgi:hypothetical protein
MKKSGKIGIETYLLMQAKLLSTLRASQLEGKSDSLDKLSDAKLLHIDVKRDIDMLLLENGIEVAGFKQVNTVY